MKDKKKTAAEEPAAEPAATSETQGQINKESIQKGFKTVFGKTEKKKKKASVWTVVKLIIAILVILLVTNPSLIPFLPSSVKSTLTGALSKLFGDVTQISSVVSLNWVVLFQLVVMVLALCLVGELISLILGHIEPKTGRWKTLKFLALSAKHYVLAIIGIFWGLSLIGLDIGTMLAGLGIAALIIGFGAESLIADVVTGIFMIFENEYNVGDIVEIDGYRGTVDKIGIRTTCLRDTGGNIRIMNNSDIRDLVNLSERGSVAVCDLPIPYEADINEAQNILADELFPKLQADYPDIFPQTPKCLGVQTLGDSAVILRIIANVEESNRFKAVRLMNGAFKTGMEAHNMGVPYNQLVLHQSDR